MYDDGLRGANPTAWDIALVDESGNTGLRPVIPNVGRSAPPGNSESQLSPSVMVFKEKENMNFTHVMEGKGAFFVAVAACGSFGTWGGYRALA
jgi:hypothetical protein